MKRSIFASSLRRRGHAVTYRSAVSCYCYNQAVFQIGPAQSYCLQTAHSFLDWKASSSQCALSSRSRFDSSCWARRLKSLKLLQSQGLHRTSDPGTHLLLPAFTVALVAQCTFVLRVLQLRDCILSLVPCNMLTTLTLNSEHSSSPMVTYHISKP